MVRKIRVLIRRRYCDKQVSLALWASLQPDFVTDRASQLLRVATSPSHRSTLLHSPVCVPTCAPQATTSSAQRRADELLTGGASTAAPPAAAVPMARPEPGLSASSSARCDRDDHHVLHDRRVLSMWELCGGAQCGLVRLFWWLGRCSGCDWDQGRRPRARGRQGSRSR